MAETFLDLCRVDCSKCTESEKEKIRKDFAKVFSYLSAKYPEKGIALVSGEESLEQLKTRLLQYDELDYSTEENSGPSEKSSKRKI